MKRMIFGMVVLVMSCILLVGCSQGTTDPTKPEQTKEQQEKDTSPFADAMEIKTDFGSLYYPLSWKGSLATKKYEEKECIKVEFYANIQNREYFLFEVLIGEGKGEKAGTLTDETGVEREVYVNVPEITDGSFLMDEEKIQLYDMQEGYRFVVKHLDSQS